MQVEKNADGQTVRLTMIKPADMHQHVRQGAVLSKIAPMVSKRFAMAIIMPNTNPPITTARMATRYAAEIGRAVGKEKFYPLMTLYLTDTLDPREIENAANIVGVKYYPPGKKGIELTTNSGAGVSDPASLWTKGTNAHNALRILTQRNLALLLHAADGFARKAIRIEGRTYREGDELDPYDQEPHFMRESLPRVREEHPDLKISVEHLSTNEGARFMEENGGAKLGCSVTQHHLLLDRRDVFRSGFHPHRHWWPIIQSAEHTAELRRLASADYPFVWLGSDSAPHTLDRKMGQVTQECCIGGVLTAHIGIEGYVEAFEGMRALDDRFERFASINGPKFYGLPPSGETITLVPEEWTVMEAVQILDGSGSSWPRVAEEIVPFRLGEKVRWQLAD